MAEFHLKKRLIALLKLPSGLNLKIKIAAKIDKVDQLYF